MPIVFAENFQNDTPSSIALRHPGSTRNADGVTDVPNKWPLRGNSVLQTTVAFDPEINTRFEILLLGSTVTVSRTNGTLDLFGLPLVGTSTGLTIAGISCQSLDDVTATNIILDKIDASTYTLTVLVDGIPAFSPSEITWTPGSAITGSVNGWIHGLPVWLDGIVVGIDTPVDKYINNARWINRTFSPTANNGWSYTLDGWVADTDKDDPTVKFPAIGTGQSTSSVTFELEEATGVEAEDSNTTIYSSVYTERPDITLVSVQGNEFLVSKDLQVLPAINLGSSATINIATEEGVPPLPGPGEQGFGVGVAPEEWLVPLGLSEMSGTRNPASDNYGNYQHTNGSICVFVPKFYYRIGSTESPRYAKYGLNCIDIVMEDAFANEAEANAAGYALHRAFIDDGKEKPGFFYDKYLASRDGTEVVSVKNGQPISLTLDSGYVNSLGIPGCTGIAADAVPASRSRGYGWNCVSIFMADAIAKIALAHGQYSTSSEFCAWYDSEGLTNFPKGCNSNLADVNDPSVTFISSGELDTTKPLTGSASNLAKTTHNGQACGITDVNGAMQQATIGVTQVGTSATSLTTITSGQGYVLKTTAKHANLTGGWNGATDAWGNTTGLANNFDVINSFLPWGSTTGWINFGNGGPQVFSSDLSGTNYLKSCSGVQSNNIAMSTAGMPLFGNDGCYQIGRHNVVPGIAGHWYESGRSGVFFRRWSSFRSVAGTSNGFRAAAYGD